MSGKEQNELEKNAVYKRHLASKNLDCHKAKMEGFIQQIEKAAAILRRASLRIVNWDNRDLITHGEDEKVVYPSVEEMVTSFAERREAEKEYTAAGVVCNLNYALRRGPEEG